MEDKYDIPGLVELVEILREEYITVENVISIFIDADILKVAPMLDTSLTFISKKTKNLLGEIEELPHSG